MILKDEKEIVEFFKDDYGIVSVNGKTRIINYRKEGIILSTIQDVVNFRKDVKFQRPSLNGDYQRSVPAFLVYLESPEADRYEGIIFDPTTTDKAIWRPGHDKPFYNPFKGFAVEPKKGNCDKLLRHIREVICAGNVENFRWLMAWLANIIQRPGERPGTAIVLIGSQGTGKSFFTKQIRKLLRPENYLNIASSDLLTGRFNAHFAGRLLITADEALWAGDKKALARWKALITEDELTVEGKGETPYQIDNYVRVVMTSNERWVVPAELDDRRHCVFRVSDCHKQDIAWFRAIEEEMENGGLEALMYHLKCEIDLSSIELREIPKTQALAEQKLETASSIVRFWHDCVVEDEFFTLCEKQGFVFKNDVYEEYKVFAGAKTRLRENKATFWKETKRIFPTISSSKRTRRYGNGKKSHRSYAVTLPTLAEARKLFENFIGFEPGTLDD